MTSAANGDVVHKFNPAGSLIDTLGDGTVLGDPGGIALGEGGVIYVGRSPFAADVATYAANGTLLNASFATVAEPYGLLRDDTYLYVAAVGGFIHRFSLADGSAQGSLAVGLVPTYLAFAPVGLPESNSTAAIAVAVGVTWWARRRSYRPR